MEVVLGERLAIETRSDDGRDSGEGEERAKAAGDGLYREQPGNCSSPGRMALSSRRAPSTGESAPLSGTSTAGDVHSALAVTRAFHSFKLVLNLRENLDVVVDRASSSALLHSHFDRSRLSGRNERD